MICMVALFPTKKKEKKFFLALYTVVVGTVEIDCVFALRYQLENYTNLPFRFLYGLLCRLLQFSIKIRKQ